MKYRQLYDKLQQQLQHQQLSLDNADEFLPSAVLVPLIEKEGELHILFEVRSANLKRQPGEICFPGGKIEPGEAPLAAAVRETADELTISEECIRVLGPLPYVVTPIGVLAFPFAGVLSNACQVQPSTVEVAECFTVPLAYLLQIEPIIGHTELATRPTADVPVELLPEGYSLDWKRRAYYPLLFYRYENRVIWGLTARVLYTFLESYRKIG